MGYQNKLTLDLIWSEYVKHAYSQPDEIALVRMKDGSSELRITVGTKTSHCRFNSEKDILSLSVQEFTKHVLGRMIEQLHQLPAAAPG